MQFRTLIMTAPLALSALALVSCDGDSTPADRVEPSFVYVELLEDEVGTAEVPLPFSSEVAELQVRVTTLDINGDPYTSFNGDLTLEIRPGDVEQDPKVELVDGKFEGPVSVKNGFGPTRVWFSDLGDKDVDSGRTASFATGVSDPIHYSLPTVGEMNRHHDHETNQLDGEFAELRAEDRDMRISNVGANGYWLLDLMDEPGSHASLFVYTFSAPDDSVELGRRLTLLTGNNQEYLATTQLSFPHYEISDEPAVQMPAPAVLDWDWCGDDDTLEGYEGAVVRVESAQIPTTFVEGTEEYEDYIGYGQWPIVEQDGSGDCSFFVENGTTVPDFFPTDHVGEPMDYVQGMLTEIWGTWILLIRDGDDIPPSIYSGSSAGDNASARRIHRPVPRHRPASK